jgi:hypothetical protein
MYSTILLGCMYDTVYPVVKRLHCTFEHYQKVIKKSAYVQWSLCIRLYTICKVRTGGPHPYIYVL